MTQSSTHFPVNILRSAKAMRNNNLNQFHENELDNEINSWAVNLKVRTTKKYDCKPI